MLSFIEFNPQWAAWSAFTFWTVLVSIVITLGFTVVVFIGGLSDLGFLLRSMGEEEASDGDTAGLNGRSGTHD